jgi:hypothetical protein
MHDDEPARTPPDDASSEPAVVTVTGTDATADRPVEMIEGVTGARIPTGDHPTSGAMPDQSSTKVAGGSALGVGILVVMLAVALFVIIKLLA